MSASPAGCHKTSEYKSKDQNCLPGMCVSVEEFLPQQLAQGRGTTLGAGWGGFCLGGLSFRLLL